MIEKTQYLLLQSVANENDFAFNSSLSDLFKKELTGSAHFMLDHFSDAQMITYAKRFIDESDELLIICEKILSEKLGTWQPVLNYCVKKKHVEIIAVGDSKLTTPFIKMMKGKVFENEVSLREYLVNRKTV